jgi:transposase
VRRIAAEPAVTTFDKAAERARRQVGRPSKADGYRDVLVQALTEEPTLRSVELPHRARQVSGARSRRATPAGRAIYALVQTLRVRVVTPLVRFEGLPGEFSQHDFGEVRVCGARSIHYENGTKEIVHFFASRLKYSRWAEVTLVADEQVESLVRGLVDRLAAFGGVPLIAAFDRRKTVPLQWERDGVVTEWNATCAGVALDLGLGVEVCWPYRPQEKGRVENLVGWVKGSFFKLQTATLSRPRGFGATAASMAHGDEYRAAVAGRRPQGVQSSASVAPCRRSTSRMCRSRTTPCSLAINENHASAG